MRKLGQSVYVLLGTQPLCCFHKDSEQLQAAELAGKEDIGGQARMKSPEAQRAVRTTRSVCWCPERCCPVCLAKRLKFDDLCRSAKGRGGGGV